MKAYPSVMKGFVAIFLCEIFSLVLLLFFNDNVYDVITGYTRMSKLDWTTKLLIWLGAFAVGAIFGEIKAPWGLLVLSMLLIPIADFAMFLWNMGTTPDYTVWQTPIFTTAVAIVPILLWIFVKRSKPNA